MKPRWTSPPVTFNGKPLERHVPRPKIKATEKLAPRKMTKAKRAAVADVTEVTELAEFGL